MSDIEAEMGVTLGPGTLYTAISRLVEQKLIAPAARDGRQRPYRLTAEGSATLEERLTAMRRVAAVGLRRLRFA
jgi:DNA-binding PadR family transcriptional regulator